MNTKYLRWLPGIAVALLGVAIARLLAPVVPSEFQSTVFVIGTCIAIVGIFLAAAGSGKPTDKHTAK